MASQRGNAVSDTLAIFLVDENEPTRILYNK